MSSDNGQVVTSGKRLSSMQRVYAALLTYIENYEKPVASDQDREQSLREFLSTHKVPLFRRNDAGGYYDAGPPTVQAFKYRVADMLRNQGLELRTVSELLAAFYRLGRKALKPKYLLQLDRVGSLEPEDRSTRMTVEASSTRMATAGMDTVSPESAGILVGAMSTLEKESHGLRGPRSKRQSSVSPLRTLAKRPKASSSDADSTIDEIAPRHRLRSQARLSVPRGYVVEQTGGFGSGSESGPGVVELRGEDITADIPAARIRKPSHVNSKHVAKQAKAMEMVHQYIAMYLGDAWNEQSSFPARPSPYLQHLYSTVFGPAWKRTADSLRADGLLQNAHVLCALTGAAAYTEVFMSSLTPEQFLRPTFPSELFENNFALLLQQSGSHHDLDTLLNLASEKTVKGGPYRSDKIKPAAQRLSKKLCQAFAEHVSHQSHANSKPEKDVFKILDAQLVDTFEQALMLKAETFTTGADCSFHWFCSGTKFNSERMRVDDDRPRPPSVPECNVVMTFVPSVEITDVDGSRFVLEAKVKVDRA